MKLIRVLFLTIFIAIFIYLRLAPILNQTVPYTYDQGRDFLTVEKIVKDKNITFIGPTTGIQGVYHGAWWYYFLSFLYVIFDGWPLGFYLGLFILSSISILIFYFFVYKEFNWSAAMLFLLIVCTGDFFIRLSFFASNNTVSPLFVLLLIYSIYNFFKYKLNRYLFLISFSIGFIFEFEVAFGLFILFSFVITSIFFKLLRNVYLNIKKSIIFFSGFIIPFTPRLLFELKNNFIQTKALFNFYLHPTSTNSQSLFSTLIERYQLFIKYFFQLMPQENIYLGVIFSFLIIYLFRSQIRRTKEYNKTAIKFFSTLIVILFFISLISRNNFFWEYYLDGIQFIILFIIILIFGLSNQLKITKNILLIILIVNTCLVFFQNLNAKYTPSIGLRADSKIVNFFVEKFPKDYFCVRIYTPPVIPYTYYYLFSYYANKQKIKYPKDDFYKNQCFFIIDQEPYKFRVEKWRKENIPDEARLNKIIKFENGTNIELWRILNPDVP